METKELDHSAYCALSTIGNFFLGKKEKQILLLDDLRSLSFVSDHRSLMMKMLSVWQMMLMKRDGQRKQNWWESEMEQKWTRNGPE